VQYKGVSTLAHEAQYSRVQLGDGYGVHPNPEDVHPFI
jgi:hypothetical protein